MAKYKGFQGLKSTGLCRRPLHPITHLGQPLGQEAPARSCQGRGWGQGGAGRVRLLVLHDSLPSMGKRHLCGLQATCERGEVMATSPPHCRHSAYVFEMWSQAKRLTEPQKGLLAFYFSPKYNLKPLNESSLCKSVSECRGPMRQIVSHICNYGNKNLNCLPFSCFEISE